MAQMQGSMGSAGYAKCGHPGCQCDVAPGKRYCSDFCEKNAANAASSSSGCGCGHSACKRS